MKSRKFFLLTLIVLLSMVFVACGGNNDANVDNTANVEDTTSNVEEVEDTTEEVVEEVVEEIAELDLAVLDTAFAAFIADMEAYNTIGLEALNTLMVEGEPFIVDVRAASEAEEKGHIEGSILIPLRELAQNTDKLPSFDTQIITYCGSGWRCTIALTALEALGWEDVKCLKGSSYGGWVEAGYATVEGLQPEAEVLNAVEIDASLLAHIDAQLSTVPDGYGGITAEALNTELVENANLVLIDNRTLPELESKGIIEAANWQHIPLQDFIADKAEWPADLDTPIVLHCGSGHRSTIAMEILWAYGYTDVRSLKSGFGGWTGAGYPAVGGTPDLDTAYTVFLADMEAYNTIGLDALNTMMIEGDPFIVDVRGASEAEEKGHIEGSILIPLRDLADNTALLPSFDTQIITYCGSGWRCTIALTALEAMGWEDVKCLKGDSFGGWVAAEYPVVEGLQPEAAVLDAVDFEIGTLEYFDAQLETIPDGYGGITAEALNTELAENENLILIDTRTLPELEEKGVIEAANFQHIALQDFIDNKAEWPADLDAEIVVQCGSGHRSTIAMEILWSYGYTNVRSLKGGFGAWTSAGYPVAVFVAE